MEPITLISLAVSMLSPYLAKSGEKIAEEIGSSLWTWLKSKFSDKDLVKDNPTTADMEAIQIQLLSLMTNNPTFTQELEKKINQIKSLNSEQIQIINHGTIEKQVNINNNNGTINL